MDASDRSKKLQPRRTELVLFTIVLVGVGLWFALGIVLYLGIQ